MTTKKNGRETLHFINAIPIQMVYDRWVSKYARGWARSLTELKYDLEADEMAEAKAAETTKLVMDIFIKTTPEKLWSALTDGKITQKYYFNSIAESTWEKGADYKYCDTDGKELIVGEVLESDPPRRLVTSFNPLWCEGEEVKMPTSRVTYEITQMGEACRLSLVHDELVAGDPNNEGFREGWASILSGLKTLLETGEPLAITPNKE